MILKDEECKKAEKFKMVDIDKIFNARLYLVLAGK